jgi:nicotinamidase/pyrazinamidase
MKRIDSIYVDCQADFIEGGSLGVPGGRQAVKNSAKVLKRLGKKITNVYASLDSHQSLQIFVPLWWLDQNNQHPQPFTQITYQDLVNGVYRASKRSLQTHSENYVQELERKGRYTLTLWPPHCKLNTKGWLLEEELAEEFTNWEVDNYKRINYIAKGNNPYTEFYSALEAEVPQPSDPLTQINTQLRTCA